MLFSQQWFGRRYGASRFHSFIDNASRTAAASFFPKISVGVAEARLSGQGGGTSVCRADGVDRTALDLKERRVQH